MAETPVGVNVVNDVGSTEKENAGTGEVLRPKIQWHSNRCVKVATIRPLPRSGSTEESQNRPQSPAFMSLPPRTNSEDLSFSSVSSRHVSRRNCTQMCPFSFDLRNSMQRVAHDQRLEELRLLRENHVAFTFRANPVRKYKPLVLQPSLRPLTVPQSPFSHSDSLK